MERHQGSDGKIRLEIGEIAMKVEENITQLFDG